MSAMENPADVPDAHDQDEPADAPAGQDPAEIAEATGGNMAYEEIEGLDRDAIGRGEVGDA